MLMFAMDCFLAGMGIYLFIIGARSVWVDRRTSSIDFWWHSGAFGLAIFLLSRWLMSFWILWHSWE